MSEVNREVVHWNNVLLPGEVSVCGLNGFKATRKVRASVVAMAQTPPTEKSAEAIVVVSEPVISCVPLAGSEECGKLLRLKGRTEEEATTGGAL